MSFEPDAPCRLRLEKLAARWVDLDVPRAAVIDGKHRCGDETYRAGFWSSTRVTEWTGRLRAFANRVAALSRRRNRGATSRLHGVMAITPDCHPIIDEVPDRGGELESVPTESRAQCVVFSSDRRGCGRPRLRSTLPTTLSTVLLRTGFMLSLSGSLCVGASAQALPSTDRFSGQLRWEYARALAEDGRHCDALRQFEEALAIAPEYQSPPKLADALERARAGCHEIRQ